MYMLAVVERLVILHEEAEDGNAMPDLTRPVQAVSSAVNNLVKVGRETINSSDDPILRQDMPASLHRVEGASRLLEEACRDLKMDPYSVPARKKLIDGARGILQGTSSLLLCFDESEVRKIIRECKKVLDYLAVAEVIETMDDLVKFVQDVSPCLARVSRDVGARGKGAEEAAENRNYLAGRMTDEINEIIRVLQLTTYDEDEWALDPLTVMKKAQTAIEGKMQAAHDWLQDPLSVRGGVGEKSLRLILENAERVADRALPPDREAIRKLVGDIRSLTDALGELKSSGQGTSIQAQSLARSIGQNLKELDGLVARAVDNVERSGMARPAHTVAGRLEQAQRYLANPAVDDNGLGQQAIALIVNEGRKRKEKKAEKREKRPPVVNQRVAEGLSGAQRNEILGLCNEVEGMAQDLDDMVRRGQGNSPRAQNLARQLAYKLHQLKNSIQGALVDRVVEDFCDITSPLNQFTEAVLAPEGTPGREANFTDKAGNLQNFSKRAAKTARLVAAGSGGNKKLAEALMGSAAQVESLTPQLINAGRIRMSYPDNKAADEHFENLRQQYADSVARMRSLADQTTNPAKFIQASEDAMRWHTDRCEDAVAARDPQKMVDHTSSISRLANRVLQVAKQEADNSEDPNYRSRINRAAEMLRRAVPNMVQNAKGVAMNMSDPSAVARWRDANRSLLDAVGEVRDAVRVAGDEDFLPQPPPDLGSMSLAPTPAPFKYAPPPRRQPTNEEALESLVQDLQNQAPPRYQKRQAETVACPHRLPPSSCSVLANGDVDSKQRFSQYKEYNLSSPTCTWQPKPCPVAYASSHPNNGCAVSPVARRRRTVSCSSKAPPPAGETPPPVPPLPASCISESLSRLPALHHSACDTYPPAMTSSFPQPKTNPMFLSLRPTRDANNPANILAATLPLPGLRFRSYEDGVDGEDPDAPPRPPLPGADAPPRPPPPETDDEDDSVFMKTPQPNQPIMTAAHDLHQVVKEWSSRDNDLILAAKRMAQLMAKLSQLVRGEGGTKRDLIACAKAIADASCEVTRLAKELAMECTDKRMKLSLLQVCERIPTIGTQLKILSTVKATMLGAQGSEEDQEATEMLVHNAQNLMQSVKETVKAAEAASIKIRTDAGVRLRWVRKQPWYQY
ncbi:unnamed protein product [Cyprideis torosa]|uniref:Vinculin n=1 Tax=Cyprideis torosa TaxID=163714 RepID=A0A7R8W787_9CRUS|nr:unnamed protein product [Cyprideis torosa]CAG0884926.1 unnamed protein product [Cyprideis torosa]